MKLLKASLLAVVAAICAADAGAALLKGGVIANGGTPATGISSAGRRMLGTAGQPAVGYSGNATRILCHGFWCFGGVRVVAVEPADTPAGLPTVLAFGPPSPNPSRGMVRFRLSLPQAATVDLSLFDVSGRRVGSLVSSRMEPGVFDVSWDGSDAEGRQAGAGYYFARLTVDGRTVARRPLVRVR